MCQHSHSQLVTAAGSHRYGYCVHLIAILCMLAPLAEVESATLTLNDGRTLQGAFNYVTGVADDPNNPPVRPGANVKQILVIDDGLRRTYIPRRHVINSDAHDISLTKIKIDQQVATAGRPIAVVGAPRRIEPFDKYGRRTYEMVTADGVLPVIQAITEITPVYTRVEAILGPDTAVVWDMRIATSSIDRDTLSAILRWAVPQDDLVARLTIMQLYLQSERFRDARLELEQILKEFPGQTGLEREVRELRQIGAQRALEEIQLRGDAGQHDFVQNLLANFPAEEVAGETLVQVREMLNQYAERQARIERMREQLESLAKSLAADVRAQQIAAAVQEISSELNHNTVQHLEAFRQLGSGGSLPDGEKLALALSGWIVGANHAVENLAVALSLWEVRDLVRSYLREPVKLRRDEMLAYLRTKEGATVEQVARVLARMNPPLDPPLQANGPDGARIAGFYELSVPGLAENPDVRYVVQLPPEYDPNKRYPTIVTLSGAGSTPEMQLDFWAGGVVWQGEAQDAAAVPQQAAKRGERVGQAMRHGYITLAVDWQKPHQLHYEYSAREHHAVLSVLRDACRHFSVDTDRVYLTGHDTGGDAAWDIGLAHPDLWAGVLPIVATADRYVIHYWPNAEYVPFYFVAGELDGTRISENARDWDRYLRGGFDVTLVEYLGRGHEAFHDEVQRMFDWMNRRRREFAVREFECSTLRPWDNFFWWLEVENLPERSMVQPALWPPPRHTRPLQLRGRIYETGRISVEARGGRAAVWLSPEVVDFDKRVVVDIGGRTASGRNDPVGPDLAVLLEDARTRADRQHPFWARVEGP